MLAVIYLDPGLAIAGERFALIQSNRRCWGPNGVSEWVWRAGASHVKRKLTGRAAVIAVLEDLPVICSVVVAVGSMIMIGIMLYNHLQQ